MSIIATYNIFVSSKNRTSGTSSDFQLALLRPIVLTSPNNFFTVRVGSVELPYTFPLIHSGNSTVLFTSNFGGVIRNSSFVIPTGNYNILNLLDALANGLQNGLFILYATQFKLGFTYDRSTGKATFSIVGSGGVFSLSLTINPSDVVRTCLGFTASFAFSYSSPSVFTNATSTQNVNVTQNTAVYVRSESFTQTQNFENLVGPSSVSDILAKIQLSAQPQSYILWTNPTDLEVEVSNRIIDIVSLYLGTSTSYTLDLGNLDWSLRLTIHERSHNGRGSDSLMALPADNPLLNQRKEIISRLEDLKKKILVEGK
jgi:hypothetical protein